MNIGQKHYHTRSALGVKNATPLMSMGHKNHVRNNSSGNMQMANNSAGIHNESNSIAVARVPHIGLNYKPHQPKQFNIEKHKPQNVQRNNLHE
jgi:hypothetical protein